MRSAAHPLCATPRCRRKKAIACRKPDGSPYYASFCNTCRSRIWRENNPIAAAFYNLKHRAKERGHEFTITRPEFEKWCEENRYHELKGKHKDGMSIDRRKDDEGYHIGNIQMMTLSANVHKENARRKWAAAATPPAPEADPSTPYTEDERPW